MDSLGCPQVPEWGRTALGRTWLAALGTALGGNLMIRLSDLARLQGQPALDTDGQVLGTVDQIYLSDVGHEPRWVTLSPASGAAPQVFAPLVGAAAGADGLRLQVTRDQVLDSPRVVVDQHLSPAEEAELDRYYGLTADGTPDEARVTLSEERIVTGTEQVTRRVRVRRHVVTDMETVQVPLKRELLAIESVPLDGGAPELIEEFTLREERVALVQT